MKTIITSVGTSLITEFEKSGKYLDLIHDMKDRFYDPQYLEFNKREISNLKNELSLLLNRNIDASAEISSTIRFLEKYNEELVLVPITTDTLLSNICADVISNKLNSFDKIKVEETLLIRGLQIYDNKKFLKEGLPNLINRLERFSAQHNIFLNFTGGYKGVIPYLTIWAQVNNVRMIYLYEESKNIIEIPQAPIDISWNVFAKYYDLLVQLKNGIEISKQDFFRKNNLYNSDFPDVIEEEIEGNYHYISLNSIGAIFLNRFERFNLFYVPANSKYFTEEPNKKEFLNKAILLLIAKIKESDGNFDLIKDDFLKHTKLKDYTFIYKYNKEMQIRIHYKYHNGRLIVYNYKFIQSDYDDKNYSTLFEKEYEHIKNSELEIITLLKEN